MRGSVAGIRPIQKFPCGAVRRFRGTSNDFRDRNVQIPKMAWVGSRYPINSKNFLRRSTRIPGRSQWFPWQNKCKLQKLRGSVAGILSIKKNSCGTARRFRVTANDFRGRKSANLKIAWVCSQYPANSKIFCGTVRWFRGTSNDFRGKNCNFQKLRGSVACIRSIPKLFLRHSTVIPGHSQWFPWQNSAISQKCAVL